MEAVGQLAGGVAHDFNNLLTVINGYSDLLLSTLSAGDPHRPMVEEIRRAGERSASLTRQLLAFSRRQVLAPQALDLNTVVRDTERMLRRMIGEDVELATELAAGLHAVRVDPGQLQQVLLNLAVNARDAMPRGGRLTLRTRNVAVAEEGGESGLAPGDWVLLEVEDTGIGMSEEVERHVFEPFFTTKEAGQGTGLGLAVVLGIVEQSGGRVGVRSRPGEGTAFDIHLPRVRPPAADAAAGAPAPAPRGTETILLVEDDAAVRSLSRHVLERADYAVLEAASGDEALELAAAYPSPIHLLVTDVVLPGMGGRQVAEALRELRPEIKVLYVSGYTDDAVVRHGVLQEDVQFLQKPFPPQALAKKVREVLAT
jgi:CheY-like chemotaxis protein